MEYLRADRSGNSPNHKDCQLSQRRSHPTLNVEMQEQFDADSPEDDALGEQDAWELVSLV